MGTLNIGNAMARLRNAGAKVVQTDTAIFASAGGRVILTLATAGGKLDEAVINVACRLAMESRELAL